MQDFCFKAADEADILSFLDSLGLCTKLEDDTLKPLGDYLFAGQVMSVPPTFNEEMEELTPVEYFEGVYAVYRVSEDTAELFIDAALPDGVEIVDPPKNIPSYGGVWLSPSVDDLIALKHQEVDAKRNEILVGGFHFTFDDKSLTLQTRDNEDRINWLGILNAATAMVMGGNGEVMTDIRTLENETINLSFADAQILMLQTLAYQSSVYKAAWDHKDALTKITVKKDVLKYDISTGWPS